MSFTDQEHTFPVPHDPDDDGRAELPLILDDNDTLLSCDVTIVDATSTTPVVGSPVVIDEVLLGQLDPPWRGANWCVVAKFHMTSLPPGLTEVYFRYRHRTLLQGQRDTTRRMLIQQG